VYYAKMEKENAVRIKEKEKATGGTLL